MSIVFNSMGFVDKTWMKQGSWRHYKGIELNGEPSTIGLSLSSGADSALLLYILSMSISLFPFSKGPVAIKCWHGINPEILAYNSHDTCLEIIKVIQRCFPDVKIDLYSEVITKDENHIKKIRGPRAAYFSQFDKVNYFIGSTTQFSDDILKKNNMESQKDRSIPLTDTFIPFGQCDKLKIADLYKKYKLMEDLFPLTRSCTGGAWNSINQAISDCPCKKCWWCKEKKAAFGMYDGAIV